MSLPRNILGFPYHTLWGEIGDLAGKQGKGELHARALFKALYRRGVLDPAALPEFADNNIELANKVRAYFSLELPPVVDRLGDGETYKFLLKLHDGRECESVVIPMRQYKTLCVSSQVGCKRGCTFCETAQMGLLQNLSTAEIVAQVFVARHVLHEPIENVVFMGMGEPTDNLDAVIPAIQILADPRGLGIPLGSITVSTVGNVPGIERLAELARKDISTGGLRNLRLAVSLNAANDNVRSELMPINRVYNMQALKECLLRWPLPRARDFLFIEYVLIAGVNGSTADAEQLAEYLRDLRAVVNLIPYNPRLESPFARPSDEAIENFSQTLKAAGQKCRVRITKGDSAMAACGQLGNRAQSRRSRQSVQTD